MRITIEHVLQRGAAAHKAGNLQEAEHAYRTVLQSQPNHPDACHKLGLIAISLNQVAEALSLFKTALDGNPSVEHFWISYIDALVRDNQVKNAKRAIKKAKKRGFRAKTLNSLLAQSTSKTETSIPSQVELNRLLDHYQAGRIIDAEKQAKFITQKFPNDPFGWKVLGSLYEQAGKMHDAVLAYERAVALSPNDPEALNNLGNSLQELGRFDLAKARYNQAIDSKPNYAEAHYNLGITLQEMGRSDEAEFSYRRAIESKPDFAEAHCNLGSTLKELGKLDDAEASFHEAIALKNDSAESHFNLANTLQDLGKLNDAISSYNNAIALKPDYAKAHYNKGITLKEIGKLDEAITSFSEAIASKSDFAEAYYNLGISLQETGKLGEARNNYTQAVALKPDYAEAHRVLASIKNFDEKDDQYTKMLDLYFDENIPEEQRCHINFGLAKACEDLGIFEQAFAHYKEGNALRKKFLQYKINQDIELFKQIESKFRKIRNISLKHDHITKNITPIFIVGMPRSGTTLVEQIISSHPRVSGAGELSYVTELGDQILTDVSEINYEILLDFRHKYLERLEKVSGKYLFVTDKMPQNFRYTGLLYAAFPEAKIVHVKRDPSAVCWANYKQYFQSNNIGYCYAIDDVVSYYRLYENLMLFWTKTLTNRIYNLKYEQLTVNQESETRQLIDYLELNWDERCLSPQNNKRNVATASNVQVRNKMYQGSSEKWKKYRPFLKGAFDDLQSS